MSKFRGGPDIHCDECRSKHPRKSQRLNPRNLRPEYALLCDPCRRRLGFALVSFDRAPANIATRLP